MEAGSVGRACSFAVNELKGHMMIKSGTFLRLMGGAVILGAVALGAQGASAQVGTRNGVAIDSRDAHGGNSPSRGAIGTDVSPSSTVPEAGSSAGLSGSSTINDSRSAGSVSGSVGAVSYKNLRAHETHQALSFSVS